MSKKKVKEKKPKKAGKEKATGRLKKIDIGLPQGFQHITHVGIDVKTGSMATRGLDVSLFLFPHYSDFSLIHLLSCIHYNQ